MRLFTFLVLFFLSGAALCDEMQEGIKMNVKLLECLDRIPDAEIEKPENRFAKSLSLFPAVVEGIMQSESSEESKESFKVALKHCKTEIQGIAVLVKQKTNTDPN